MKIEISTDRTVDGREALATRIDATVRSGLERHEHRLTRVEVHLSDDDGDKDGGGADKRCLLEARPAGLQPVVVTGFGDTPDDACRDATQKMVRLLDTTFGRIDDKDAHASIRQSGND